MKLKLRNEFQHAVPRAAIRRGRPAQPQDVGAHPASHSRREPGQQLDAYPRAEVARITVRRVVVEREARLRHVRRQLRAGEREQRPHETAAAARRHPREPGGPAPPQHAQQDRLDLVVRVMRRDEVARGMRLPDDGEPRVARAPRRGLGRIGTEVQLPQLERDPAGLCEPANRLTD
ncbi:MAG: hypothetical protein AUH78_12530 [Gemmatimonadetes bacterium 13_1_40CM_4_69_8]|nr:MAG: hypothetical protein AUH78_12530 [Gemmatimonadetes bacterium 13_1_40CM_4_69_8]